jgi:DNA-binding MarR family transcriptional regulator
MVSKYRPLLDELDITYPQYLVMMVMWEHGEISVKDLGTKLSLDSGTLTPLIKRLCAKDILEKKRSSKDERVVQVMLTEKGSQLKEAALSVPGRISCTTEIELEKLIELKATLDGLYGSWTE